MILEKNGSKTNVELVAAYNNVPLELSGSFNELSEILEGYIEQNLQAKIGEIKIKTRSCSRCSYWSGIEKWPIACCD